MENKKLAAVLNYVNKRHNQDKCIGFIDGYEKAIKVFKPLFDKMVKWVEQDFPKGLYIDEFNRIKGDDNEIDFYNNLTPYNKFDHSYTKLSTPEKLLIINKQLQIVQTAINQPGFKKEVDDLKVFVEGL